MPRSCWRARAASATLAARGLLHRLPHDAAAPDELVREIRFRALGAARRGIFLKLGLRRAQAISVIDIAVVRRARWRRTVSDARIALGCLAPTVVRALSAERFLAGKRLDAATCAEAGRLRLRRRRADRRRARLGAAIAARRSPRWSRRALERIARRPRSRRLPRAARAAGNAAPRARARAFDGTIETTINGRPRALAAPSTRRCSNALRENAGLTGAKEGCAEGECGACTVWLDGAAVMSCLVPAPQAHGATITTSKAWPTARRCTRCSRRTSTAARCSAASASPA